jgi:biopolymer transport protein ExbD/biopolymer transport protein TolR
MLANRINKMVFIRSDARARYEKVVTVVDNLRAAGVDQVGLLTEQVKDQRQQQKGAAPAAE